METLFEIFKGENELSFVKRFGNPETCMEYLSYYKWKDGFECPHCGSIEEHNCYLPYSKRCKKCQKIVSCTSHTLFHRVKFGLDKAFYMVFKMSATTKSISAEQLARTVGVNRKTALAFQHKIRLAMQSSGNHPLEGQVEVDEAFIGQKEPNVIGRGAENKAQIVLAVEKHGGIGIKRVYARMIENASSSELKQIFDKHISKEAKVVTDKWRGYSPLTELFNITQEKSEPDKNFKVMHRCVQLLKSWIRGIHHSVDKQYLQAYLNEFCYRINRSIHKETIFDKLIQRMVYANHVSTKQIKFAYNI